MVLGVGLKVGLRGSPSSRHASQAWLHSGPTRPHALASPTLGDLLSSHNLLGAQTWKKAPLNCLLLWEKEPNPN